MSENKKNLSESEKEKLEEDKKRYPVEPFPEIENPTEKDEEDALEELNPDEDSMDDERG